MALGTGELVAGLVPGARSLIVVIGDATIDRVPSAVKEFAIATFGTNDKLALISGILVVLTGVGALLGLAAQRRFWLGAAGIVLLGAVGLAAALDNRLGGAASAAVPSVVGTLSALVALRLLVRRAYPVRPPETSANPDLERRASLDRRTFLQAGGMAAAVAVGAGATGRWLQRRASAAVNRVRVVLRPADRPLPPIPQAVTVGVDGVTPFFTPNAQFYRVDTALEVPKVDVESWRLKISGMVDRPLELSFTDLQRRELVEADITLTCVSNEVGDKLLGTARWLGVRLVDVLRDAGIQPGADQVVGRSVDDYTCGFPVRDALDGREALIAIGMNGEPLPPVHGFPARLIVPGLYGYVSATKWLTEIELTTFEAFDQYWVPRGWDALAPIKTQSRIDVPRAFAKLVPGPVAVAGVAWAQTRGIANVEIQVDDGPWMQARLAEPLNDVTWRQWVYTWQATPGYHQIQVRATDSTGQTQPEERATPFPNGATGWHQIVAQVASTA
jgi:DMSO/TMAO reductase YedYZ molybdopterin-dependent catalytic subunit